ncbi:MAG TPA: type 4a pilus biogenesis protein PilO [Arenimonas sp.]|nr:type 4a pilus biogenesis protein PilO [Arenimonas sp.]
MSKKKFELSSLDINNTGVWPYPAKVAACLLIGVVILFLAWWVMISSRQDTLKSLEAQESALKTTLTEKQGQAANLEPLKLQLVQMEQMLKQMLRQLPSKNEMPDLIVDISQTALATGINNELFEPQPETKREFYAEKPINLRMVGTYHQFGAFVSGVASLPRVVIMTMHNISLKPKSPTDPALELKGTVKTYRYLSEDEAEAAASAAAKKAAPAAAAAENAGGATKND